MNWGIRRVKDLYPDKGLAFTYSKGCLGTTYGQERWDNFFALKLTMLVWTWTLRFDWKGKKALKSW